MANRRPAAEEVVSVPETKGVLAATAKTIGAALGAVAAKVGIASPETPTASRSPKVPRKAPAKKTAAKKQTRSGSAVAKPKKSAASKKAKTRSR